ncbi:protein kinase domain-containing protein [Phytoactinopolyspora limicola]|uniref:protein kinase domain-containing protein n=1 Tax=Phytoactinopolyspora limicola TaxID=2715536 RepID=UPI001409B6C6|nr:PASTA domain-containing protein [Phytoactinopolyspora limicola]
MRHHDAGTSASDGEQDRVGPFGAPDRYKLTELRSRGGEGELWAGSVDVDGQELPVAVKILPAESDARNTQLSERLRGQAELLRSLDHPNLVKVREAFEGPAPHRPGESDPSTRALYFVMNLVPGENLVTWVERRPDRDPLEATRIISRLAAAIDYLHRGEATGGTAVLHRDVKPANVIVTPDGAVRLVDFGFARFADADSATLVGTPAYLAPEIVAGAPPSKASDRFGLGAIAYYLFTGEPPNPLDTAGMRTRLLAVTGVDDNEGFASHVLSMLERDPSRRPTDVVEWAQALAVGTVSQKFQPVRAAGGGRSRRGRLIGIAAAAVILVGAAIAIVIALAGRDGDTTPIATDADATADADPAANTDADSTEQVGASESGDEPEDDPEVPDVTGHDVDAARDQLAELGFDVHVEREASAEPSGTVLSQQPRAGSTTTESVTLVVAEQPVTAPDVVGERLGSALRELESLGVTVETIDVLDEDVPDGEVIQQEPAAGQPFSDDVLLTVSRRPVITFLADQSPVEGSVDTAAARISGDTFTRSVLTWTRSSSEPRRAGFDLGRGYREFRAVVGPRDDAPSDSEVQIGVYGDGRLLFEETLGLGDAAQIDIDVTGVLRLELVTLANSSSTYVVWGDAQVLGSPDEVPETTDEDE